MTGPVSEPATRQGPGRLLVAAYAVFAVSASARSAVQIATQFTVAPVSYLLSAVAAVVYLVATVGLMVGGARTRRLATAAILVELVGVLVVGTLTVLDDDLLADQTVWSGYGVGYGFVPLVLPVLGLAWVWRTRPGPGDGTR